MKLISFDVGIRNMAYCIFNVSDISNNVSVLDWNIINLMDIEQDIQKCNVFNSNEKKNKKSKKNKNNLEIESGKKTECGKKAKYEKNGTCFCEKHAKTSVFLMPIKECSPTHLKKLKIGELQNIATKYKIQIDETNISKKLVLETLLLFFSNQCLHQISIKKKSANDLDLISIGKNLKKELNLIDEVRTITNVIIENQISPIANRMKTIQGMLAQYFIMNDNDISIEFLSAAGKLKGLEKQNENLISEYKQHKKDAIFYCTKFLEKENFCQWKHILNNKKKDDLADCFLQGIWYLQSKNNISCV
jgi:hypothetical protein